MYKKWEKNYWNVDNISKFLEGGALTVYVNDCINYKNYTQITEILAEKFIKANVPNFAEFSNLKIENMSNLKDFFNKKMIQVGS